MQNKQNVKEITLWILLWLGTILSVSLVGFGGWMVVGSVGYINDTLFGGLFFIATVIGAAGLIAGLILGFICIRKIIRKKRHL